MVVQVFDYPTESGDFQSEFLFATDKVISYEYTKKWVGTGYFTLVFPLEKKLLGIKANCVLRVGNDWLFVNNVKHNEKQITVSGTDLNGWLDLRITVFGEEQVAGASGYDVVKGTTGECVNHYIQNNMTAPEDGNRKMPRLKIGQTAQGKEKDSYMARLKVLTEVVGNLCANATIGYEIVGDIENNCFVFNTLAGVDRSIEQTENSPVIFSQLRNNLFSATYESGNEDLLNAVYSTGADVTQLVVRDDEVPMGILRRETAIDISVETVADIKDYTLAQITGNIENNSYELDIRGVEDFGKKYRLGDYITVKDAVNGQNWTAQIKQATRIINQSESKIKIVPGDAKTKLLNKIQNSVTINTISESNKTLNTAEKQITDYNEQQKQFSELTANAMGFYQTEEKQPDGTMIYYQHDKALLADSTIIWKKSLDSFAVSTDGGVTWKGFDKDGNSVFAIIAAEGIVADWVNAGTLKGVKVIATTGSIAGWKMENDVLVSDDGSLKIDSRNNTITINDDSGNKLIVLSKQGIKLYRDNNYLGFIGTNRIDGTDDYGLVFDLDLQGKYMSWGVKEEEGGTYIQKLAYYKDRGFIISGDVNITGKLIVNGQVIGT